MTATGFDATAPRLYRRIVVALTVGLVCGIGSYVLNLLNGAQDQDFRFFWLGSKMLLEGRSPYVFMRYVEGGPGFFQPLTAAVITAPFVWMPVRVAGPIFIALSCGLLAYVVTARAWWPLLMFLSGSMFVAVRAANLTPLVTIGFFLPSAMWLGAVRPNAGLAMLAYRPSVRAAATMLIFALACLIIAPRWPLEWLDVLRQSRYHHSPISAPGGYVLALVLLCWRQADARLLLVMSLVPCSPIVYDALPIFVIPRRWQEAAFLATTTMIAHVVTEGMSYTSTFDLMEQSRPLLLWTCYVPAMLLVFRHADWRWLSRTVPA